MKEEISVIVLVCKNCNEIRESILKQTSTFEQIELFKLLAINDNIRELSLLSLSKFPLRCKCKNHDQTPHTTTMQQSAPTLLKSKLNDYIYTIDTATNTVTNITNGIEKVCTPEEIKATFVIPIRLNHFAQQNENLIRLITVLKLAVE